MIDIKHIYIYFLTFSPTKYIKIIIYQLPSLFYRCISRQNALCCLGWLSLVLLILLGELKDEKLLRIDLDLLSLGPFILCFWIYLQLGVTFQFLIRILLEQEGALSLFITWLLPSFSDNFQPFFHKYAYSWLSPQWKSLDYSPAYFMIFLRTSYSI